MIVERNLREQGGNARAQLVCFLPEPLQRRTSVQNMLILAHLTVAMIELNVEERLRHGYA
jgi:hypothetical protein